MTHTLMTLPFDTDAFEPYISKETLNYHHGKHHAGYVNNLNDLIAGTEFENMELIDIVKNADGAIFNNAAQIYNHNFYWMSMTDQESEISDDLMALLVRDFYSFEQFKLEFIQKASTLFGSGWTWLSLNPEGKLIIEQTHNADNPLLYHHIPLLTCDVWEHAYYIDYRNARAAYIEKWWSLVDWDFVSHNVTKHNVVTSHTNPERIQNEYTR
ncbi:MAG: superoxide dismutase [Epsilonproteobacteria bacterium]|nr:superoxide dismutase [Campylobacterota bacterium]